MSTFCDINKTINEIKSSLNGKKLALFLDFDGTLAEIQTIPDNTYMTKDMSQLLGDISRLDDEILLVAISGRKIEDLQRRVGLKDIVYSGNHGLELCLDGGEVTYCLDDEKLQLLRTGIRKVIRDLNARKLGKECGGNIEDKDTAMTWHFFNVAPNEASSIVKQACTLVENRGFPVFDGVGCIEVRHPSITKGDAMKEILYQKLGANWHETHHAIFIGDSSSDEDGYLALRDDPEFEHDHVTFIRILTDLKKTTTGKYVFRGCDDVYSLLHALNDFYSLRKSVL